MKKVLLLIIGLCLNSCMSPKINSDRVFSNAQVLYQKKEFNHKTKETALQMPSYFLELEYEPGQTELNAMQVKKVNAVLHKIVYPDEYKIYASFGSIDAKTQFAHLVPTLKRAEDIKNKYAKKVKEVKIAYLKNQKPNCVYIRLLG